jgi:hypothetical protein
MSEYIQLGRVAEAIIINTVANRTILVQGLRIVFKIKKKAKKKEGSVNVARIDIYNMSKETRKNIETVANSKGQPQTHIELKVGYKTTDTNMIFRGLCVVSSKYVAPNWITTLKGEDGKAQFKYSYEKTFSKGTTLGKIVKDIAEKSGIAKFDLVNIPDILKKSRTFSGPPLDILAGLQKTYDFVFDIQDEGTIIRSNKYEVDARYLISMSYERGLLGEPRTKGNIVIIDTLINPDIRPNSFIDLTSKSQSNLDGRYVILQVTTIGDSYSGDWKMHIEMISVNAKTKVKTKEV